jgi:transposase
MSHAAKDALILALLDRLEAFLGRLEELEGKVEKTSKNSSQPPSSDGQRKESARPSKKGERPVGGASGHKVSTLQDGGQPRPGRGTAPRWFLRLRRLP